MVESAYSTLREVDTVLFMVPADEARGKGRRHDYRASQGCQDSCDSSGKQD